MRGRAVKIGSQKLRAERLSNREKAVRPGRRHQRLAIRKASIASASNSARQTQCPAASLLAADGEAFLAARAAALTLRIGKHRSFGDQMTKAPG